MNDLSKLNSDKLNYYDTEKSVEALTSFFYKNKFSKILEFNDQFITSANEYTKIKLLKSKALFELNHFDKSLEIVNKLLVNQSLKANPDYIYTVASLYYFKKDYEQSLNFFKILLDFNQSHEGRFKALLGLGNLAYTQKRIKDAREYLCELKKIVLPDQIDLNICCLHFEANLLMSENHNLIRACELLKLSYTKALGQGWSYFCHRSLYLLAKVNQLLGKTGEAFGVLEVLDIELKFSDSRYLAKLVNLEFEKINFKASNNIKLDNSKKLVIIGGHDQFSLSLQKWPILFSFIELIHKRHDYVSKEQIALTLWSEQKYKPRTHDPRIYDLVKRLKKEFEAIENNPLKLEGHSGGYRLNFS